jgi:hypothetical protein
MSNKFFKKEDWDALIISFKLWLAGILFKFQKKRKIDLPASPKDLPTTSNSDTGIILADKALAQEVKEQQWFATKNNLMDGHWEGPEVYNVGEVIDRRSALKAAHAEEEVFSDDVEMVQGLLKAPDYTVANDGKVNFKDFIKPKFYFKKPEECTKEELIEFIKSSNVPFDRGREFDRYGKFKTSNGWSRWEWYESMFTNATFDTLYNLYLKLNVTDFQIRIEE